MSDMYSRLDWRKRRSGALTGLWSGGDLDSSWTENHENRVNAFGKAASKIHTSVSGGHARQEYLLNRRELASLRHSVKGSAGGGYSTGGWASDTSAKGGGMQLFWLPDVQVGFGRIVALHYRSSTLYQIC